jgi:glutathione S-transferase
MGSVSQYSGVVVKLFRAPWSTNVERVTLALAHKGLEYESVVIDYSDRSPVEVVSGQGVVPVLVDGDTVVADSTAILRWLEERHPDPPLFPPEGARLDELESFVEWFNSEWKSVPNELEALLGVSPLDDERIASLVALMDRRLDAFELLLGDRAYLLGAEFSAADCIAYPFLKYARSRDPGDDELFHRILDEYQSCAGRPALEGWINRVSVR